MSVQNLLALSALLMLVCWQGHADGQGLAVSITITYTPPPNTDLEPNEYRVASGPFTFTCEASGAVIYIWTSNCFACIFTTATTQSVTRTAFRSTDSGNHTCTAVDAVGTSGSATEEVIIVGVGIFVYDGDEISPIETGVSNNSLVISRPSDTSTPFLMSFRCRSDSRQANIGEMIGLDGNSFLGDEFLLVEISTDITRPADVLVRNVVGSESPITPSQQGVYTCRIPDKNGVIVDINIGIYPAGFNSPPTINGDLELFSAFSTLTCTSTSSPATNVVWMKDGVELNIDGMTYTFIQIVSNRAASTYENVLTINSQLSNILSHTYTCRVSNTLGEASHSIEGIQPLPFSTEQTGTSVAGGLLILTCIFNFVEVIITGQPVIEWINIVTGDSDITLGTVTMVDSTTYTRTLQFNPLQTSHGGEYTCQVSATVSGDLTMIAAQATVITKVPNPTVIINRDPSDSVTLHHGDSLTLSCIIQLDPAIDSSVIVIGELSGPGGATNDLLMVSNGMYQISLTIPSLQESLMDIYTCNSTISPHSSLIFVTGSAEVSVSIATSVLSLVPSIAPSNVKGDRIDSTRMRISWDPLSPEQARGFITHYIVMYQSTIIRQVTVPGNETTVVIGGLTVTQSYSISVSAATSMGNGESSPPQTVATTSTSLVQLLLIGGTDCSQVLSSAIEAVETISTALQQGLEQLCQCGFTSEHISDAGLQCLGDANQVTYRARIYSTGSVSNSQLHTYIARWIEATMTIVILGVRVDIESNCSVNVESFSDPECQPSVDDNINIGIIVGAAIGSTVILIIAATIIVIVCIALRNRHDQLKISQTGYELTTADCVAYGVSLQRQTQSVVAQSGEPATAKSVAYGVSLRQQVHPHDYEIPVIENASYSSGSGQPPLPPRRVTHSTDDDNAMYEQI